MENIDFLVSKLKDSRRFYPINKRNYIYIFDSETFKIYELKGNAKLIYKKPAKYKEYSVEEVQKISDFFCSILNSVSTNIVCKNINEIILKLDLSNLCNMNCSYCFVKKEPVIVTDVEVAKKAIDWILDVYAPECKGVALSLNLTSEIFMEIDKVNEIYDYAQWRSSWIYTKNDFLDKDPWDLINLLPEGIQRVDGIEHNLENGILILNKVIDEKYLYKELSLSKEEICNISPWFKEQVLNLQNLSSKDLHVFNCACLQNCCTDKNQQIIFFYPRGQYVSFHCTSNGTIINNKVLQFINKWHPDYLEISLDGEKVVNDINRKYKNGNSSYVDVVNNIKYLMKQNYNIHVLCTITPDYPYVNKLVKYFYRLGISELKLHVVRLSDIFKKEEIIASYKKVILEITKQIKLNNNYFFNLLKSDSILKPLYLLLKKEKIYYKCEYGKQIIVDNKGDVYPCDYVVGDDNFIEGSIYKNDVLLLERKSVDEIDDCKECCFKYLCGGICYINNIGKHASFECELNREIIKANLELYIEIIKRSKHV